MDAIYFLKNRTAFIRFYYDKARTPFSDVKYAIENGAPPFAVPEHVEEDEPLFVKAWTDAHTAENVLGLSCVSILSDSVKLYFETLERHVIGFRFSDPKAVTKLGLIPAYKEVLGHILDTDWSDCPADLDVIKQIVLTRNRGQHGAHFTSLNVQHDAKMLQKHPTAFFATDGERDSWVAAGNPLSVFFMPDIDVTRDNLFTAITEVEKLAEWIDGRLDRAQAWRQSQL